MRLPDQLAAALPSMTPLPPTTPPSPTPYPDSTHFRALEIEKTVNDADVALRELGELELALVGGGTADVGLA